MWVGVVRTSSASQLPSSMASAVLADAVSEMLMPLADGICKLEARGTPSPCINNCRRTGFLVGAGCVIADLRGAPDLLGPGRLGTN